MRKPCSILFAAIGCVAIFAADWPTQSGSPLRDSWARAEKAFTKENAAGIELLYKYRAENASGKYAMLTSPLIDGMLITYRGFKEMLVFAGSADNVYSVDADLNRTIWSRHFDYQAEVKPPKSTAACPGGLTASIAMAGSSSAALSFGRRGAPPPGAHPFKPIGGSGFGSVGAFFIISSDGYLHALNASTGLDLIPAAKFVPPNSKVSALNVFENTVYAATSGDCGGNPNALYALDPSSADKKVSSFVTNGAALSGINGSAIGADGTVYVQVAYGTDAVAGALNDTVLALEQGSLKVKDYFTPPGAASASQQKGEKASVTPLVFTWKTKDVIVAASGDGRLYLLDATSLGGADHHKPMVQTQAIAADRVLNPAYGFTGTFASWTDADSATRWLYAPMVGPPNPATNFPARNGDVAHGALAALKIEEQGAQLTLQPAWISEDMPSPDATVTANGLVFTLDTGEARHLGKIKTKSTDATLRVLDGASGKTLYGSGSNVNGASLGSGLALANGRIYLAAADNTMYCFGFLKSQPQLTGR